MAARWPAPDIPTAEIYRLVRQPPLRVSNPSTYKGHLCAEQYGHVFVAPAYQKQGLVRFANQMFRVYVNMRESIYEGLKERVDTVWASDGNT
jgi:hypothetical protein